MKKLIEAFWSKVNKNGTVPAHRPELGNCWEWTGFIRKNGYGQFLVDGRMLKAHRFAFQISTGEIPKGEDCCHKCDNRKCVRPDHLFTGSRSENMDDCVQKGRWNNQHSLKTHCANGHLLSGENVINHIVKGKTWRYCRACKAEWKRKNKS